MRRDIPRTIAPPSHQREAPACLARRSISRATLIRPIGYQPRAWIFNTSSVKSTAAIMSLTSSHSRVV
jgi:hypothetical protein